VRLVLRDLDGEDRSPIHPAKGLEIAPSSRIATFSRMPSSLAFATAASTIFCASSEAMLCSFTTLAIGHLPPLDADYALIHLSKEWGDHAVMHGTQPSCRITLPRRLFPLHRHSTCGQALVPPSTVR